MKKHSTDRTIPDAIKQLLKIVGKLHRAHPSRRFTLDGRLVGDIGEVLAAQAYQINLADGQTKLHDGVAIRRGHVQIKATMKESVTFPANSTPDYFLAIKIHPDGSFSEVYNGPGADARRAVAGRGKPKVNYHVVSIWRLADLNQVVDRRRRVLPRRDSKVGPVPLVRRQSG